MKKYNFKKIYIITIIILFLILAFLIFDILKNYYINKISYQENSQIDYRVHLKNNDYFDKEYLENNTEKIKEYIAGLIENIDITFEYKYKLSEKQLYTYKYYINTQLIITEKTKKNNILYYKEYPIIEHQEPTNNNSEFNIKETINIDYQYYNNIIDSFKQEFILSIDSYLETSLTVQIESENTLINKEKTIELSIPLSEKIFEIEEKYDKEETKNLFEKAPITLFKTNIIFAIIDTIIIIVLGILLIKLANKTNTYYKKKLKKIIDEYDSIIVEINNMPNTFKKNIIDVQDFLELVDARDNEKSILHIETKKDKESQFLIINSSIIYRYILKDKKWKKLFFFQ